MKLYTHVSYKLNTIQTPKILSCMQCSMYVSITLQMFLFWSLCYVTGIYEHLSHRHSPILYNVMYWSLFFNIDNIISFQVNSLMYTFKSLVIFLYTENISHKFYKTLQTRLITHIH